MSETTIGILIFSIWSIIAAITIIVWIFVKPEDDLEDICIFGLLWPFALLLIVIFAPFKLLEILQNKLLERRAKKKYYNEDENWYDDEYGIAYIESNYKDKKDDIFLRKR